VVVADVAAAAVAAVVAAVGHAGKISNPVDSSRPQPMQSHSGVRLPT
jgi:hypothetical protein